jgi:hypothetical protein
MGDVALIGFAGRDRENQFPACASRGEAARWSRAGEAGHLRWADEGPVLGWTPADLAALEV